MRLSVRLNLRRDQDPNLHPSFQGSTAGRRTSQEPRRSTAPQPFRLANCFQGHGLLNRKDNSPLACRQRPWDAACYQAMGPDTTVKSRGVTHEHRFELWNKYQIPFRPLCGTDTFAVPAKRSIMAFAGSLGPADPWTKDVHMEPFPTSVLQSPTRVFATTTKICTRGGSTPVHTGQLRSTPPRPPTRHHISCQ